MIITLIAAMDQQRLIGANNQLPWHLPADLRHFKELTMGKDLLMGRKTYDSIGRPLPGRTNIVLSKDKFSIDGCLVADDIDKALALVRSDEVFVMGGASIYRQMLPLADKMELTLLAAEFTGDTWFPDYDHNKWQEISRQHRPPDAKNAYAVDFVSLHKK